MAQYEEELPEEEQEYPEEAIGALEADTVETDVDDYAAILQE